MPKSARSGFIETAHVHRIDLVVGQEVHPVVGDAEEENGMSATVSVVAGAAKNSAAMTTAITVCSGRKPTPSAVTVSHRQRVATHAADLATEGSRRDIAVIVSCGREVCDYG